MEQKLSYPELCLKDEHKVLQCTESNRTVLISQCYHFKLEIALQNVSQKYLSPSPIIWIVYFKKTPNLSSKMSEHYTNLTIFIDTLHQTHSEITNPQFPSAILNRKRNSQHAAFLSCTYFTAFSCMRICAYV